MFILHGNPISTCTRRVLLCLIQMGLEVEKDFIIDIVDLTTIKTPEWLIHQPFAMMPYLEDTETGIEIFESRSIAKYVGTKLNSPLIPIATQASKYEAYAKFETACSIETANFDPHASTIAMELVFKQRFGQEGNKELAESHMKSLADRLEGYELILSRTKYLAGDSLTLADLFHVPYGKIVAEINAAPGLTDGSLPNVTRWWKEISGLESWAAANAFIKH